VGHVAWLSVAGAELIDRIAHRLVPVSKHRCRNRAPWHNQAAFSPPVADGMRQKFKEIGRRILLADFWAATPLFRSAKALRAQ
jgi:hypothetical protein